MFAHAGPDSTESAAHVAWSLPSWQAIRRFLSRAISTVAAIALALAASCGNLPAMTARRIVVLNHKGGTGKTHLAYLIAAECERRRLKCLLVDLDQQANLTSSFLVDHRSPTGVERLLDPSQEPDPAGVVHSTKYTYVDIIPATPLLAPLDLSSQAEWEKSDLHLSLVEPLAALADNYEFIVMDCPPRLSLTSFAALCAGDEVLIPLEAANWGARGTHAVVKSMRAVQERFNPSLRLLGYVVSRYKSRRSFQQEYLRALRETFGDDAFATVIPDLADFEKAVTDRTLVSIRYPDSNAARIAREFFDELVRRQPADHEPAGRQPSGSRRLRRRAAVAV